MGPFAVNMKPLRVAWVLLESVDLSVQRPLLRGQGWVGPGPCRQSPCTGQAGSTLEHAAGLGWACGNHPKGQEGGDTTHVAEGPRLLSSQG